MTTYAVIEASAHHCGAIARALRGEHLAAVQRRGVSAHRELRARFDESSWRRAFLIDGRLAALGGLSASLADATAAIWLAIADWAALAHPIALAREARRQIDAQDATRNCLRALILIDDKPSFHFAQRLGFAVTPESWPDNGWLQMERRPFAPPPSHREANRWLS